MTAGGSGRSRPAANAPTRRAVLMGGAMIAAWTGSRAPAMLDRSAPSRSPASIDRLIARMTVEEKAGQLTLMVASRPARMATALNPATLQAGFEAQLADVRAARLTGVFNSDGAVTARTMQQVATRESRLGIPLIFAADVIHGHRTVFPVPLAEASSFDPELARRTARASAIEAAASGIDWTFAPMVDVSRDARWGRGVEGAGEDVLLNRLMAVARVRGFQGERGLSAPDAVAAGVKHFTGYGASEAGLDYAAVNISRRTLAEVYLPPFQSAFDAGAATVMAAFTDIDGVPATGNRWLLHDLLRTEMHFAGPVVSDYTADEELIAHGLAEDARQATRIAFMAGVDISMQSGFYLKYLPDLVARGDVPMARLDEAVHRVLTLKQALGLFDDPFRRIDPARERRAMRTPDALRLAREAGRRSIVMLRNEGDILPLRRTGQRIALIGPFVQAQRDLIGPWTVYGLDSESVPLLEGMRAAMADPSLVTAVEGSGIDAPLPGGIDAAIAAARAADVVVLAVGESQLMSGEAQSRSSITVPAAQRALAEAVAQVGKPLVVLLRHGRALALEGAVLTAPAILATWFLGSQSGHAIADILFGREGPSGRLPVSFPHATGQEPYYYAHRSGGRPAPPSVMQPYKTHFREFANDALFPFGHGLTYGRITYADLVLGSGVVTADRPLEVSATLTNNGSRAAEEIAQLYVQDVAASYPRPVRELKQVKRIRLNPGQSVVCGFTIKREDLSLPGPDLRPIVEPGRFRLWIAPSSQAEGEQGAFVLV